MRDEIYRKLSERYKNEEPKILKEAAYNLALASSSMDGGFWGRAEKALSRIRESTAASPTSKNVLSEAAQKAFNTSIATCGICKQKMTLAKLLDNREAFFCPDHRICQPIPVGE